MSNSGSKRQMLINDWMIELSGAVFQRTVIHPIAFEVLLSAVIANSINV
jgi:hypothetical protein